MRKIESLKLNQDQEKELSLRIPMAKYILDKYRLACMRMRFNIDDLYSDLLFTLARAIMIMDHDLEDKHKKNYIFKSLMRAANKWWIKSNQESFLVFSDIEKDGLMVDIECKKAGSTSLASEVKNFLTRTKFFERLTNVEIQIYKQVEAGKSYRQIARDKGCSYQNVHEVVRRIKRKAREHFAEHNYVDYFECLQVQRDRKSCSGVQV